MPSLQQVPAQALRAQGATHCENRQTARPAPAPRSQYTRSPKGKFTVERPAARKRARSQACSMHASQFLGWYKARPERRARVSLPLGAL